MRNLNHPGFDRSGVEREVRGHGFGIPSSGHCDPPVQYSLESLSKEIVGAGDLKVCGLLLTLTEWKLVGFNAP